MASDDLAAIAAFESRPLDLPSGLELEWLGVSGYRMTYEGSTIFIDPYVSRAPLSSLLLRRTALHSDAMIDRYISDGGGKVEGVLVGHTHFDHAIDAPAIARKFGAPAYGSRSLANLMSLHGKAMQEKALVHAAEPGAESLHGKAMQEKALVHAADPGAESLHGKAMQDLVVVVEAGRAYELGPFVVRFVRSAHSKLILGKKVPMAGELTCDHLHGLTPGAYKCGQVWGIRIEVAGVSFYHQGSADLLDDELPNEPVDYFLAGVAGRFVTKDYWRRILPKLDPAQIVPTHYDNFFKPLGEPLTPVAKAKLDELPEEIASVSGSATISALPRIS